MGEEIQCTVFRLDISGWIFAQNNNWSNSFIVQRYCHLYHHIYLAVIIAAKSCNSEVCQCSVTAMKQCYFICGNAAHILIQWHTAPWQIHKWMDDILKWALWFIDHIHWMVSIPVLYVWIYATQTLSVSHLS